MRQKKYIRLAHEAGFIPADWDNWKTLVNLSARAQTLAENICNGSPLRNVRAINPAHQKQLDGDAVKQESDYEKKSERVDERLTKLAAALGLEIDLNGDPRGAVVKVRGQGIKGNSWSGEGWFCVA